MKKLLTTAFCLGLAGFFAATPAQADPWSKRTLLTVHESIQVPGAVLEPGEYVMKLHNSQSSRNIVQVFNGNEDRLVTTFLSIPHYRIEPKGETELRFWETASGEPQALRTWFYPGDLHGHEFIYPKATAMKIAGRIHGNVPSIAQSAASAAELEQAPVQSVDESGVEHTFDVEAFRTETLSALPVETASIPLPALAVAEEPAASDESEDADADAAGDGAAEEDSEEELPEELPETSGATPLAALLGVGALGAGAGLRRLARRAA
jgi:hypothetical protein